MVKCVIHERVLRFCRGKARFTLIQCHFPALLLKIFHIVVHAIHVMFNICISNL